MLKRRHKLRINLNGLKVTNGKLNVVLFECTLLNMLCIFRKTKSL